MCPLPLPCLLAPIGNCGCSSLDVGCLVFKKSFKEHIPFCSPKLLNLSNTVLLGLSGRSSLEVWGVVDSKEMVWALMPEAGSGKLLYALVPAPLLRVVSPILRGMLSLLAVVDFKETDLITSPGWMHETGARTWCTGKT